MAELAALAPTGGTAAWVSGTSTLHVFPTTGDIATGERRLAEKAHLRAPYTALAWAPPKAGADGEGAPSTKLALGSATGVVTVWDVARGEVVARLGDAPAADGGSSLLAAAAAKTGKAGGKRPRADSAPDSSSTLRHTTPVSAVAWCPDGRRLFSASAESGSVLYWDSKKGAALKALAGPKGRAGGFTSLAVSPDGRVLFAGGASDVCVIDVESGSLTALLAGGHSLPVSAIAMPPGDASLLATIADERNVCVWDSGAVGGAATTDAATGVPAMPPAAVLLAPTRPVSVAVAPAPGRSSVFHVAALGEDGAVSLFRYKREKAGSSAAAGGVRKPVKPSATLRLAGGAAASGDRSVLAVALVPTVDGESALVAGGGEDDDAAPVAGHVAAVMVGPGHAPAFYRAAYVGDAQGHLPDGGVITLGGSGGSKVAAAVAGGAASAAAAGGAADGLSRRARKKIAREAARGASSDTAAKGASSGEHVAGPSKVAVVAAGAVKSAGSGALAGLPSSSAAAASDSAAAVLALANGADDADAAAAAAEEDDDDADGEETLGSRLAAVISGLRGAGGAALAAGARPPVTLPSTHAPVAAAAAGGKPVTVASALASTGSLATVLAQALHAGDDTSLELVLSHSDKTVVAASVARLPPSAVLPLLSRLVAKLQARPGRGTALAGWLRPLLASHAGYLLGLPDLADRLGGLYALLDARLGTHKKLLKLQGRLELVMAQAAGAAAVANAAAAAAGGAGGASYSRALKRARRVVSQAALDAAAAMPRNPAGAGDDLDDADGAGGDDSGDEEGRALLQGREAGGRGRRRGDDDDEGDDDEGNDSDAHLDEGFGDDDGAGGDSDDDEDDEENAEGDADDDDEEDYEDGDDDDDE